MKFLEDTDAQIVDRSETSKGPTNASMADWLSSEGLLGICLIAVLFLLVVSMRIVWIMERNRESGRGHSTLIIVWKLGTAVAVAALVALGAFNNGRTGDIRFASDFGLLDFVGLTAISYAAIEALLYLVRRERDREIGS